MESAYGIPMQLVTQLALYKVVDLHERIIQRAITYTQPILYRNEHYVDGDYFGGIR